MSRRPVVVDGSNLATEGRSLPSLAQLDEAVRAWLAENPDDEVIVVVDASFSYRIDESERKMFEEAEDAGEVVSPPAGAVGRGDGFLLRIADRVDAAVLSNDSFQEFHGEYKWLFDSGRLLGGKPVPGVGWIFTPRTPVRGPKSRMAVRDAQRATKGPRSEPVVKAIAVATAEAIEPANPTPPRRGRRRGARSVEPAAAAAAHEAINEPLPFVTFIAEHPLGTEVEGTVDSFTSHGAFVEADGARCYVPVVGLGDPPPRTAKAVLTRGEVRTFVVQALDPPRRGIELALPEAARVAGAPTQETVEAEIGEGRARRSATTAPRRSAAGIPPPPRGRQTPVRTGASDEVATPTGQPGVAAPAPPPVEVGAGAVVAPPPRRSSRRRTSAPATAPVEAPSDAAETAAPPPRRRRASRAPVTAVAPENAPTPVGAAPAEPATDAPAPPRRRLRAAAADTDEAPETVAQVAGEAAPEAVAVPAPAPRARRATKKSPAAPVDPAESAAKKAPSTRARRTTKKAAAPSATPAGPAKASGRAKRADKAPGRAERATKAPGRAAAPAAKEPAPPEESAVTAKPRTRKRATGAAGAKPAEAAPAATRTRRTTKKAAAAAAPATEPTPPRRPAKRTAKKVVSEPAATEAAGTPPRKRTSHRK